MEGAAHVYEDLSILQRARFAGDDGERMLTTTSLPLRPPQAGVVICSSLHAEFPKNYRREVLLSRHLACFGLAVQRFHYRGSGHSDGEPGQITFESLVDDALTAADRLREETGVTRVAFMGTRLGGLVAAATGARFDGGPVALWEPVANPDAYFREVFRARLMSEMKDRTGASSASGDALLEELAREGIVDVLGYPIHRSFYESLRSHHIAEEMSSRARPILLVQLSSHSSLRPDYAELDALWRSQGHDVTTAVVPSDETWWFTGDPWRPDHSLTKATPLLQRTEDWLLQELSGSAGLHD